jgi:hypothetical protein
LPPSNVRPSPGREFDPNLLKFARLNAVVSLVQSLFKYAAAVACAYYVYLSVAALAGKQTLASIGLNVLGNVQVSHGVCAVLTGGSILYGVGQRQLRHRAVKRIGRGLSEAEAIIDRGRSSSGLSETGTTPGRED